MSVDLAFHLTPGLTLVAHVERLKAGPARLWWDDTAGAWSADPAAAVPVEPDPTRPGLYRLLIDDASTAKWPDCYCRLVVVNPAIATADQVVFGPLDFQVTAGTDTFTDSFTYNVMGGSVTLYNARLNAPAVPAAVGTAALPGNRPEAAP